MMYAEDTEYQTPSGVRLSARLLRHSQIRVLGGSEQVAAVRTMWAHTICPCHGDSPNMGWMSFLLQGLTHAPAWQLPCSCPKIHEWSPASDQ